VAFYQARGLVATFAGRESKVIYPAMKRRIEEWLAVAAPELIAARKP
jgi:hypothetical protein